MFGLGSYVVARTLAALIRHFNYFFILISGDPTPFKFAESVLYQQHITVFILFWETIDIYGEGQIFSKETISHLTRVHS